MQDSGEAFDNRLLSALTESAGATNNNTLSIIINDNNNNYNNNNDDFNCKGYGELLFN